MYNDLKEQARLLLEADLKPLQGQRFQPTGFPDLGPAEFPDTNGVNHLLVESAQSMANRLENVIWDEATDDLVEPLRGMPYVKTEHKQLGKTNSILEAHRLSSAYLIDGVKDEILKELGWNGKGRSALKELPKYLFKRDTNSLIHGIFLPKVGDGSLRLTRLLSAFIEAEKVIPAASGGVKFDRVDPSGSAKDGKGHVPFNRVEYTAEKITAYFNLDLHQLRSFGLSQKAEDFLITLALFKIRKFLEVDLRLRTACDLDVKSVVAKRPEEFELPTQIALAETLKSLVKSLSESGEFANPPVLEITSK